MDDSRSCNGFEENTMALLDSSGIKDSRDIHDDRVAFLEAVRSISLDSDSPSAPSWNMCDATFKILSDSKSLELAMTSYQLLNELNKRYPRAYLSSVGTGNDLIINKEAWSPFILRTESVYSEREGGTKSTSQLFDSSKFAGLVNEVAQVINSMDFPFRIETLENMLMFHYLVNVLESDFIPRQTLYRESLSWVLFRESMLNMLLGSRKIHFKSLIKDFMSIMLKRCNNHQIGDIKSMNDYSLAIAFSELANRTFSSVQKLLTLVMELDLMRKEADSQGITSRIDGVRSSALEIILDELTYDAGNLPHFLMAFSEPKWKLEIILQYFSKYCTKSSVRTRRSNEAPNELTVVVMLSYFSTSAGAKGVAKKITLKVAQFLLAHAFQTCLSLERNLEHIVDSNKKIGGTIFEISNSFISAFQNLKKIYETLEISPFEKEALFTAAIIAERNGK